MRRIEWRGTVARAGLRAVSGGSGRTGLRLCGGLAEQPAAQFRLADAAHGPQRPRKRMRGIVSELPTRATRLGVGQNLPGGRANARWDLQSAYREEGTICRICRAPREEVPPRATHRSCHG